MDQPDTHALHSNNLALPEPLDNLRTVIIAGNSLYRRKLGQQIIDLHGHPVAQVQNYIHLAEFLHKHGGQPFGPAREMRI
ncbi:hypothetical protein D3C85_1538220 [compost metagenome]